MALVKYNNRSILNVTALGSIASGGMNLIATNTISSGVSSSSFTSGIDSTYDTYLFKFINMHPATATAEFQFQANASGGSGFNETMTTTMFQTYHYEDGSGQSLNYRTSHDQAQGTAYQSISDDITNDNDGSCSGYLYLFSPSSTTFLKHFISRVNTHGHDTTRFTDTKFCAGIINTTSAIDEISYQMSSGNIDSGVIKMYGITK